MRKRFPSLVRRLRIDNKGTAVWTIPEAEKENVLRAMGFNGEAADSPITKVHADWEKKCAEELEQEGYVTILTDKSGMPDVFGFRKRADGGFDLAFREAKGPGDTLSKAQFVFIEEMVSKGIDAAIRWY